PVRDRNFVPFTDPSDPASHALAFDQACARPQTGQLRGAADPKLSKLEGSVSIPVGTSRPVLGQTIITMAMPVLLIFGQQTQAGRKVPSDSHLPMTSGMSRRGASRQSDRPHAPVADAAQSL